MSINQNKHPRLNKTVATAIILVFISAILFVGTQTSTVKAAEQQTYSFIVASPNPDGVNQSLLVIVWVGDPTPTATTGIGQFRTGYKVTITKPDNTTEFRITGSTDPATKFATNIIGRDIDYEGGAYFTYTPTELGNYTFAFDYAGDVIYTNFPNGTRNWNDAAGVPYNTNYNYTALPSSATYVVTVQETPAQGVFKVPLPTEYWDRPIYAQNYFWSEVSSNWLMAAWNSTSRAFDNNAAFVPEGTLPNSAHVLWTKSMTFGGLAGGIYGNIEYYSGMSYEMYFQPPIIIGGRLYYTTISAGEPRGLGSGGPFADLGTVCVDLNTGQELFTIPNATMSYGQIFNFVGPNQAGTHAYLWSGTGGFGAPAGAIVYDAWSGTIVANITNMPSGVVTFGKNGEIIIYSLTNNATFGGPGNPSWQLAKWNSTKVFGSYQPVGTGTQSRDYSWRPYATYNAAGLTALDGNRGYEWRVAATNASGYSMTPFLNQGGTFDGNNILTYQVLGSQLAADTSRTTGINVTAYDMTTGAISYTSHISPAPNMPNVLDGIASFENIWEFNGHLYSFNHYTLQWVAYDVKTGNVLWITDPLTNPWAYYNQATSLIEAYGFVIAAGFDGIAHGYNMTTGKEEWSFFVGNSGALTPYGHYTFYDGITVIDGKAILLPNEHGSGVEPLYQNLTMNVIDAKTGALVWSILGYFEKPAVADGILLSHNNYDNQIYAFGKGPTATTISAPAGGVYLGQSVVISGTVTDTSPGATSVELAKRFPSGVPAVSDSDQSAWMEYLYMKQAFPTHSPTGVEVNLSVLDSNNNYRDIGTVTTDGTGYYSLNWKPDIPGKFTVYATFAGSESYWSSHAEAAFAVDSLPETKQPEVQPSMTDTYVLGIGIAIIIAVAIVGAILAMLIRRRP